MQRLLRRNLKASESSKSQAHRGATRSNRDVGKESERSSLPWSKLLLATVAICLLAGVLWIWPSLMNGVNQPIARVEVRSSFDQVEEAEVRERLAPWLKNRFFYLDLDEMRKVVLSLAWVKEASLRREWPDKLVINLEERSPIARWKDGLIDVNGEVFRPNSVAAFGQLPLLSGPEDQAQIVMQQYLAISQLLRPLGISVRELSLSSTDSWWFKVDHVAVNIGRDRRMERLQRFVRLYHAKLSERWQEVKRIDLRYLNGASVAWE